MWFDYFEFGFTLKKWKGIPQHEYKKPYDCFTCTNFWIGFIISGIYGFIYCLFYLWTQSQTIDLIVFIGLNYIVGNVIDHIKYE